jgi:hypothetical protein
MLQSVVNISAEELFGATSRLVVENNNVGLLGIASLGSMYQLATGVVALFFIFIAVRYFDLFRYLIISSISKSANRSDIHIYSAEIKNIEILTSLIGAVLIALLVMRISVMDNLRHITSSLLMLSPWGIGVVSLVGIIATMCGERLMLYIIGAMSGRNDACNTIWHIKLLYFCVIVIVLSPLLILTLLTEGVVATTALYISVAVCSVSLVLFIKETFLLFRAQRFSIFHWILYLCALEIFPLSLLLAPILRG